MNQDTPGIRALLRQVISAPLPDYAMARAVKGIRYAYRKGLVTSDAPRDIDNAFTWMNTREGESFWSEINDTVTYHRVYTGRYCPTPDNDELLKKGYDD